MKVLIFGGLRTLTSIAEAGSHIPTGRLAQNRCYEPVADEIK